MRNNITNNEIDISALSQAGNRCKNIYFFVMFGQIMLTSGFGIPASLGGTVTLIMCSALAILLALSYNLTKLHIPLTISVLLFLFNVLITTIFREDELQQFVIYAVYILIALVISQTMKTDFNVIFVRLFCFLAVFSLALLAIYLVLPSLVQLLPTITNRYGLSAYTALFSTITSFGNVTFPRNQGIFWEPGAYQTFLNIAAAITLFSPAFQKKRAKYTAIFALAVFTTFSTTGYVVFCGLLLVYCLNEIFTNNNSNVVLKYSALLLFLILLFLLMFSLLPQDLQFQLFGKLGAYLRDPDKYSSTSVRMDAITAAWNNFLEHPLLGCGTNVNTSGTYARGLMTCTPLNYFAYYGIFVGVLCNWGLFRYAKLLAGKTPLSIAVFVCLSLSMISENYIRDPIILSIIFIGLSAPKNSALQNT